ncbi:MAG: Gfo/Idh/MocA family oxidoreductase [Planctomycetes bacterium]|nr:Gfo/Idh/MocA family oxidoreductase [Planctomycetota bacterium]
MARKIRVGVIGLGLGKHHLAGFHAAPDVEVTALADLNTDLLDQYGAQYGVENLHTDYRDLLKHKKIDGVSIALPNWLHKPVAVAALRAGKHVMVEKPAALNAREAAAMLAAAGKAGKILMIAVNNRYRSDVQYIRDRVAAGDFGKVYSAKCGYLRRDGIPTWGGWFMDKAKSGGGPIIDLGVHMIDMTLFIMGWPKVQAVSAAAYQNFQARVPGKPTYTVEDHAVAQLRLEGGAVLSFETSWASHIKEKSRNWVEICGTKAGAKLDPLEVYTERDGVLTDEIPHVKSTGWIESIEMEAGHFAGCIRTGKTPLSPGEHGVDIMIILDAIYKSARLGREVRLT